MRFIRKYLYYLKSILELLCHIRNLRNLFYIFFIKNNNEESLIELRNPSAKFLVRTPMDVWSIKETFLDAFYIRYGVPIQNGWTVVDVGAGVGDFTIKSALGNLQTVIYAFEPYIKSYELLIKNIQLNHLENIYTFQQAIWWQECQLELDLSKGDPLKISSRETSKKSNRNKTLMVQAVLLEKFIEINEILSIDLLKLDCEGAEFEILLNSPYKILKKIKRIIMEYHEFDIRYDHSHLENFLRNNGYKVNSYPNIVHNEIGYIYAEREV